MRESPQGAGALLKPFQIGCRIEHPQSFIDRAMYHLDSRPAALGAAEYHLVSRPGNGVPGVSSFCMCPGGFHQICKLLFILRQCFLISLRSFRKLCELSCLLNLRQQITDCRMKFRKQFFLPGKITPASILRHIISICAAPKPLLRLRTGNGIFI